MVDWQSLTQLITVLNDFVWSWLLVVLLLGTHLFLTLKLGFIQRYLFTGIRLSVTPEKNRQSKGEISPFGALATALGGTVGTGNIAGVSTALSTGGPGAIFWMWMSGVLGIATRYAETVLSVKYRQVDSAGARIGGPMFVLQKGLGAKWLAGAFAVFTILSALGSGNAVQSNSIAVLAFDSYSVSTNTTGLLLAALTGIVIFRGIRGIAVASEYLVPIMTVVYILACLYLLYILRQNVGLAILQILKSAFSSDSAVGGLAGIGVKEALRYGSARGLFSNEAGQGSAPIAAAAARTPNSVRQGLIQASTVFWDTIIICALTGIVLVSAGDWQKPHDGVILTVKAFDLIPVIGAPLLTFSLFLFVFTTILGWCYYGEIATEYLWGRKFVVWYRLAWVITVWVGSTLTLEMAWVVSDLTTGLMAFPSLIAVLLLWREVKSETQRFIHRLDDVDETLD